MNRNGITWLATLSDAERGKTEVPTFTAPDGLPQHWGEIKRARGECLCRGEHVTETLLGPASTTRTPAEHLYRTKGAIRGFTICRQAR